MNRRNFTKNTGLILGASPLFPYIKSKKSEKYRLAIIGAGWWGNNILAEAIASGRTKVVGICDVDQLALESTRERVKKATGDKPEVFEDYREMLKKVDAEIVIIGTPDHWHALSAIEAIKNGAHVYLEKPISHTINEGKAILKAARGHDRVVQVGTHRRVSEHNISAMTFLKSGKVGDISVVKAFVNYGSGPGEMKPTQTPPSTLNWDMWIGPAQMTGYNEALHPKGFRQYLNFANGQIGDWGIHWFDQVLWWTEERAPKTIFSTGTRHIKKDNSDAPDSQLAIFEFENFTLHWEHKICTPNANEDHNVGCYFYGTEGTLHLGWLDGWTFYPKDKKKEVINVPAKLHEPDHQNIKELWEDMIDAIESKRRPVCDIKHGYLATNISLLAMISYRLGRSIEWDNEKGIAINDPAANALLSREYRGEWEYPGM